MLQTPYDQVRRLGRSFEQQADVEYEAMVSWVLGPLADDEVFAARLARKRAALVSSDWSAGLGTAASRYLAAAQRDRFAVDLVERFPQ